MNQPSDYIGRRYRTPDGYMQVIGFIDRPAIVMKDPLTGRQHTVVIGCANHQAMEEITEAEALKVLESEAWRMSRDE